MRFKVKSWSEATGEQDSAGSREIKVRRNWLPLVLMWLFAGGLVAVTFYTITWPAIKVTQLGQPLFGGWTWPTIIVANVVAVFIAVGLGSIPLNELRTVFTDEGIKVPGLWRTRFMRWEDIVYVDGVSVRSLVLKFTSSDQSVAINKTYYLDQNELMSVVQSHLPESIYWRD
ncbi:MAG TPA: hypothetical protein VN256_21155 [Pyrinomonadaceae bacterium]|nr:hypothetical protein [Pyrinomonadaceae bacterium]